MNVASKQTKSDKGNKRKATRVQRACSNCRKRKQGCEEERPCRRCVEKGIDCVEVEPKRKKAGRVKTHAHRSKVGAGSRDRSNEEMPDYEEDEEDSFSYESEGEAEDSYDSEEEDQSSMVSPRGNTSNTSSPTKSGITTVVGSNSESSSGNATGNVVVPHTFKLNLRSSGSNTSSNNLHTAFSQHSHSHSSHGNCDHSHSHSQPRSRSHSLTNSVGSHTSTTYLSDQTSSPDSPNPGDVNDEYDNVGETDFDEPFYMDDVNDIKTTSYAQPLKNEKNQYRGLCLSLLLPFIGNIGSTSRDRSSSPMFVDEDYGYLLESESNNGDNYSNSNSMSLSHPNNSEENLMAYHFNQFNPFSGERKPHSSDSSDSNGENDLQQKILGSNLPFYTNSFSSKDGPSYLIEEGDIRSQVYIKECWEECQYKSQVKSFDMEIQRVSDSWKEIMRCLRNLEWQKAQVLMQEMEDVNSGSDYFGESTQPSFVMWSSGGRIHHANESFCKLVGYSLEELRVSVSADPSMYHSNGQMRAHSFFHPEEMMKILKRQLEAVQSTERSSYQMSTRLLSKSRIEIPISCSVLNLRDNMGASSLTIAIFV